MGATIFKNIKTIYKDQAWFTANAERILAEGQIIWLAEPDPEIPTVPRFKRGDGVTELQNLIFSASGTGGVQSVTGPPVDITDPSNPVVNAPTQASFDALNTYVVDVLAGEVAGKQPLNTQLTELSNAGEGIDGDWYYNDAGVWVRKTTAQARSILRMSRLLSNPHVDAANTGSTNETIVGPVITVPTGTFEINDAIRMWGKVAASAANSKTFRVYINITPDLTGTPVQILAWTFGNSLTVPFVRNYTFRGSLTSISALALGSPGTITDEGASAIANANFTIASNAAQPLYIIRTIQNTNAADTHTLLQHFIHLLKSPS